MKDEPRVKYPLFVIGILLSLIQTEASVLILDYDSEKESVEVTVQQEDTSGTLQRLEVSNSLEDWKTIARKYDAGIWHGTQPEAPTVLNNSDSAQVFDSKSNTVKFYRLVESPSAAYSGEELISAFLRQTTFGPRHSDIQAFIDNYGAPSTEEVRGVYEAWVEDQINVTPFSHRVWFRKQSNPDFVDQSSLSESGRNFLGEVGHDSSLGHRLPFYLNSAYYKPNESCPLNGHGGETGIHVIDAVAARPELNSTQQAKDLNYSENITKQIIWFEAAFNAEDQLRQRMAWALNQHFVTGEEGSDLDGLTERWTGYYDIFVRHAFGNFRDILSEVTWNPHMGYYLSSLNSRKEDLSRGFFPDENYAREVMQLFTIGLWELHPDGRLKLDVDGYPIPTYDNEDITEFAKIFTGMARATLRANIESQGGNWIDPMRIISSRHDYSQKVLLDGSTHGPFAETIEGAVEDIEGFLDFLFNHPNVPPFFARFLIQRFTISNPSPQYIEYVANAFATGTFEGQGTGLRGDLEATIKAVLLHPEARSASLSYDPNHGKLREPLIRYLHVARAMNLVSTQTYGMFLFQDLDDLFGQGPYQSPTVFNFYLPEYQPNGAISEADLYAPEFQPHNDVTGLNLLNAIHNLVYNGLIGGPDNAYIIPRWFSQGDIDFTETLALASSTSNLLEHLDLVLCAGRMTDDTRSILMTELEGMPSANEEDLKDRVRRAISLLALTPEYSTLY